jgi:cellulase (glycosyl hydrolase family 5)
MRARSIMTVSVAVLASFATASIALVAPRQPVLASTTAGVSTSQGASVSAGLAGGAADGQALPSTTLACAADALQAKQLLDLQSFAGWLKSAGAQGYIGEVGWPSGADGPRWNALANAWYTDASADGLWVTAWSTGEWWGSYPLQPYVTAAGGSSVDAAGMQASVLASHPSSATFLSGVNNSGGEFGANGTFSNTNPGTLGTNYHYDSTATFQYLASQGVKIVRLPFRWERLQPRLYGPLNMAAVAALQAAVARAASAGLKVILDMHNYGSYITSTGAHPLGTKALSTAAFVDFWSHFSDAFAAVPGVAGYDLMNEPHDLPSVRVWQQASQDALTAIRARGDKTMIMIEGYAWAGTRNWASVQPTPWISDPASNFRYEAHQYFDLDSSGTYADSYSTDLAAAESEGFLATC